MSADLGPTLARHVGERSVVELRGDCPREIVDVLDAVAIARDVTRIELVNTILRKWARERSHEAMLVARVTRGQSALADERGGPAE